MSYAIDLFTPAHVRKIIDSPALERLNIVLNKTNALEGWARSRTAAKQCWEVTLAQEFLDMSRLGNKERVSSNLMLFAVMGRTSTLVAIGRELINLNSDLGFQIWSSTRENIRKNNVSLKRIPSLAQSNLSAAVTSRDPDPSLVESAVDVSSSTTALQETSGITSIASESIKATTHLSEPIQPSLEAMRNLQKWAKREADQLVTLSKLPETRTVDILANVRPSKADKMKWAALCAALEKDHRPSTVIIVGMVACADARELWNDAYRVSAMQSSTGNAAGSSSRVLVGQSQDGQDVSTVE